MAQARQHTPTPLPDRTPAAVPPTRFRAWAELHPATFAEWDENKHPRGQPGNRGQFGPGGGGEQPGAGGHHPAAVEGARRVVARLQPTPQHRVPPPQQVEDVARGEWFNHSAGQKAFGSHREYGSAVRAAYEAGAHEPAKGPTAPPAATPEPAPAAAPAEKAEAGKVTNETVVRGGQYLGAGWPREISIGELKKVAREKLGDKYHGVVVRRYGGGPQVEVLAVKHGYHGRQIVRKEIYKLPEAAEFRAAPADEIRALARGEGLPTGGGGPADEIGAGPADGTRALARRLARLSWRFQSAPGFDAGGKPTRKGYDRAALVGRLAARFAREIRQARKEASHSPQERQRQDDDQAEHPRDGEVGAPREAGSRGIAAQGGGAEEAREEVAPFARGDEECHWITLGGTGGDGDGEGKGGGGSPVCIQGGRIVKGAPSLTGKRIDALDAPAEVGSHREQLRQSREYARAVHGKNARKEGIDPKHLHQLAGEMVAHDKELAAGRTHVLREARSYSKTLGHDLGALKARAARGIDEDAVRHLDDVAQSMAYQYPEHFAGHRDATTRLFDMLAEGNPKPISEDDAYKHALEHLREHGPRRESGGRRKRREELEEAPFAGAFDESQHPRGQPGNRGQFTESGGGGAGRGPRAAPGAGPPLGAGAAARQARYDHPDNAHLEMTELTPAQLAEQRDDGDAASGAALLALEAARANAPAGEDAAVSLNKHGTLTVWVGTGRPVMALHVREAGGDLILDGGGRRKRVPADDPGAQALWAHRLMGYRAPRAKPGEAPFAGAYDESKHPRGRPGNRGQFTESGGGGRGARTGGGAAPAPGGKETHPLAGKSDEEARAELAKHNHPTAPSSDPYGVSKGAVTSADPAALGRTVGEALAKAGGFDRPTVAGLYDRAKAEHPGLTVGDFHRQLVGMQREGKLNLHPYTLALRDLPRPQLALPFDRQVMHYVSRGGRAAFAADVPLSFTPWHQEAA